MKEIRNLLFAGVELGGGCMWGDSKEKVKEFKGGYKNVKYNVVKTQGTQH